MRIVIQRRPVRRVWITVHHTGQVVVVASTRFGTAQLWSLVRKNWHWIKSQRKRFREMRRIIVPPGHLLYRGKIYRFVHRKRLGSNVLIYSSHRIIASGVNLLRRSIQQRWYINESERLVGRRTRQLAERFGFEYKHVRIGDYISAWGYCSLQGELSFDWRIAKVPPTVMDYLILHELVHTEVLSHNRRFWRRLMEICPDYYRAVEWLHSYGRWV